MERTPPILAGLGDRYRVDRQLGAGGMATVYLAHDRKHDRQVAVKVLRPELAASIGIERFLREIGTVGRLVHPHILPLHDSGDTGDTLYYVMPFLPGKTLRERLADSPLAVNEALDVATAVGQALDYAHRQGVIHRDIKPDNILMHDGTAMVTDFGIALPVDSSEATRLTETGLSIGTPQYMSPEQASGDTDVGPAADVYALGAVLYEMLTGEPPHAAPTVRAVLAKVMTEPPTPPREIRTSIPQHVEAAVLRALAKEPSDRFPSAGTFVAALSDPDNVTVRPPRTVRSRRWVPGVAAVVMGAAAVSWWMLLANRTLPLDPQRVLVSTFANETGDAELAHVGKIVGDWLARGIQETGMVEVIDPRASVFHDPSGVTPAAGDRARALAEQAGAGLILRGSYAVVADSFRFEARVSESSTGTIVGTAAVTTGLDNPLIPDMQQEVLAAVATAVSAEGVYPEGTPPNNYAAYLEYTSGVEALGQMRMGAASAHFFRAAAIDPTFAAPALYNVTVLWMAGQPAAADSLAEAVHARRQSLTVVERHVLDSFRGLIEGNWDRAYSEMERAHRLAPGVAELTYAAGLFGLWSNRLARAEELITAVDPATTYIRFGWRDYWNRRTQTLHHLGKHRRELADARDGLAQFGVSGPLAASELRALAALGHTDEMRTRMSELGPRENMGVAELAVIRRVVLRELRAHGHHESAEQQLEDNIGWYRQLPTDETRRVFVRLEQATALGEAGLWREAGDLVDQLLHEAPDWVEALGVRGVLAALQGDTTIVTNTIRKLEAVDDKYRYGEPDLWVARVLAVAGDTEQSVRRLNAAAAKGAVFRLDYHRDPHLDGLRGDSGYEAFIRSRA